MKITITKKIEVDAKFVQVSAGVRYWEDGEIDSVADEDGDLTPCRNGDMWCPIIDIDSGIITNWEQGKRANLHYKVCDNGNYKIKDADNNIIHEIDGYVPKFMCPGGSGYGDYIIMTVYENGTIEGWEFTGPEEDEN